MTEDKPKIPRRSLTITPTFDPYAKLWFVDEFPGVEAPTLRELLQKLPKGTKLTNYYPNGMTPPRQKYDRPTEIAERILSPGAYGYKSGIPAPK